MIITAFEELERHAREEYQRRMAKAAKPRVINAQASVALEAPRCFLWGGLTYWVPPLSYESGLRLFVVGLALAEVPERAAPTAAVLIWRTVRPTLKARIRHALKGNPFRDGDADDLESLARWLTHVPDESGFLPSSKPVTLDLIDARYAFEAFYGRPPRSWADYICGCHHMARANAREELRIAVSTRAAYHADKNVWRDYESDTRSSAGW